MHIPALVKEVTEGLNLQKSDIVLDCTVGDGSHAKTFCGKVNKIIGLDLDEKALAIASENLKTCKADTALFKENFRNLDTALGKAHVQNVDKILFDLGLRSGELEEPDRGFSFRKEGPLLMTFDSNPPEDALTARDVVNAWSERDLSKMIKNYGEERFARRIAKAIAQARKESPIERATELASVIEKSVPGFYRHSRLHPATKTFQALRIAVNDELGALKEGIEKALAALAPGGRIAVISFHSLEDRIVKNIFRDKAREDNWRLITKKPVVPTSEEREANPKARSAKLRIIMRIVQQQPYPYP